MTEESVSPLVALGFTPLEAEIYAFLLRESPATGYRVAQALNRPVANTYKTIEALHQKGAIVVDQGSARHYRAIPGEELLARLERRFEERCSRAAEELARVPAADRDDRIYQLDSREQVYTRCRSMIEHARRLILIDACPLPLDALAGDLRAATARGTDVLVKGYQAAEVGGARMLINPKGEALLDRYPGQWVVLVVDGAEELVAFFTPDGREVLQAIWTSSAYLSWIFHTSLAAEFLVTEWFMQMEAGTTADEIRAAFHPLLFETPPAGKTSVHPDLRMAAELFGRAYSPEMRGYREMTDRLRDPRGGRPHPAADAEGTTP